MLKKFFPLILSFVFFITLLTIPTQSQASSVQTSAKSAVLINADTKEVLYEKNAYEKRSMASTTKIMTAIVAIENADLKQEVQVTKDMIMVEGTSMGLHDGQKVSIESLLYGLLLESGNDAANVIAHHIGGSMEEFADMMNETAKKIGMNNTNFVTPSGLDHADHYTTAYDMAILGAYAIKNTIFAEICSSKSKRVAVDDKNITYTNHNRLLKMYDDCIGIKTGFTKKSGRCLVSAAQRNNVKLIAVTLNDKDDWNDAKKLFDYGFSVQKEISLTDKNNTAFSLNVVSGEKNQISAVPCQELFVSYKNDLTQRITQKVFLRKFCYAPIEKGEVIGKIVFFLDGEKFKEVDLIASESVKSIKPIENKEEKKSFFQKIIDFFNIKED